MKFGTKAIHVGYEPDPTTGAIMPPIFMTSTYIQEHPGEAKGGYDYTRAGNPNFTFLENALASLENARFATVFSSGLGALTALVSMLKSGDKVVAFDGVYGGTYRLFDSIFKKFGIEFISIDPSNEALLHDALHQNPKWLFFETPTNPLLEIYDIKKYVKLAQHYGVLTIVDNTFATPFLQNPLDFGVDIVWHSSTKYLGGHSDVVGGVVMTNHEPLKKSIDFGRKALGTNPSPFDAWLVHRGIKTLAIRMEKHQKNAARIAEYLSQSDKVKKVYYPGLANNPGHEIAKSQMRGFGGMVSVEFDLPLEKAKKLISSFKLLALAESLGGVESLVCHPATMTHASIPADERQRIGLKDGLIRFSIGIEDEEDILEDLNQALCKV